MSSQGLALVEQGFVSKYQQRSFSQRCLIILSLLILLAAALEILLAGWLDMQQKQLVNEQQKLSAEIISLHKQIEVYSGEQAQKANSDKRKLLVFIDDRIAKMESSIAKVEARSMGVTELMRLMETSVTKAQGLRLLDIQLKSMTGVSSAENGGLDKAQEEIEKNLISLRIQGDFSSIKSYLQQLEDQDWPIYWSALDYQVQAYPQAIAKLELYSLSGLLAYDE